MTKEKEMWQFYHVKWSFKKRLCGTVPLHKELVSAWLNSRKPNKKPDNAIPIEQLEKEVLDSIEETIEKTTVGFQSDDHGLIVRGATIKAHVKDCSNQIKDIVNIPAFKSKVANRLYVEEYFIPIKKDGKQVDSFDNTYEQPIHVMTARGPRDALKIIQYVEQPVLEFTVRILTNTEVNEKSLKRMFQYGEIHGYGGERSMGEGQYTLEEFVEIMNY